MRVLGRIITVFSGIFIATLAIGGFRVLSGPVGSVSVAALSLTVLIFFGSAESVYAFATGLGIGLDLFSSYPFFVWTLAILLVAGFGQWLFRQHLTNRSLFALLALGLAIRVSLAVVQPLIAATTSLVLRSRVAPTITGRSVVDMLVAIGIELITLFLVFVVYSRVRGRAASTVSHAVIR
jgi:hypothetical protein